MITDQDITKLKTVFATKQELKDLDGKVDRVIEQMVTKQDFQELKMAIENTDEKVSHLVTIVENLIEPIQTIKTENTVITSQLNRHDKWIKTLADKAKVKIVA